jgi:hypothetical protein
VDTPGAGVVCRSCEMDWHEMWVNAAPPATWASSASGRHGIWNMASSSVNRAAILHPFGGSFADAWDRQAPPCDRCAQSVDTMEDPPSMKEDMAGRPNSIERAAVFVRFFGDSPSECDGIRDSDCGGPTYHEACCVMMIVEAEVRGGLGALHAHYFEPVCGAKARCELPNPAAVVRCMANGDFRGCGFAGAYYGLFRAGDPTLQVWPHT